MAMSSEMAVSSAVIDIPLKGYRVSFQQTERVIVIIANLIYAMRFNPHGSLCKQLLFIDKRELYFFSKVNLTEIELETKQIKYSIR